MALNCGDMIRQALGRSMTEEETLEFARQAKALADKAKAGRAGADASPAARELAARHIADKKLELRARERAAKFQQAARLRAVNYALDSFQGMEWEGVSAMMVGSKYARPGARYSVDAMRGGLTGKYIGGMVGDMQALGNDIWQLFRSGRLEREIMEAMFCLDREIASSAPEEAVRIAEVLHKWQERARLDENEAGAWIGKLPGYILRQSHDADKIRRAGFEEWSGQMLERLDWETTARGNFAQASESERRSFLQRVYDNLITGMHEKSGGAPEAPGSIAARASRHRTLHFKSGSDFYEYNRRFGKGTLIDGVIAGLSKSANDTALMRMFGPSPQANLAAIVRDIKETYKSRGDVDSIRKMSSFNLRLENQMKELDGSLNTGGDPTFAEISRNIRAIQSMAKLGGAVISGLSDIPLLAQEFQYQGRGYFRSMADGLASFVKGRGTLEQRQIMSSCGVFFDSMAGNLTARFSGNELPGKMAAMMNLFFRANGLSFWSDAWKKSATLMMSHDLAQLRQTPWHELSQPRRRVLGLYGIDDGCWDMLRECRMQAADGREYLTPEACAHIPADRISAYLKAAGMLDSPERAAAFREELANRLRSYFKDRVQYAVLEPDARTASIIHQGHAAGTVSGELMRFCMQFKSFPAVFLQRTLGREIYGRGADSAFAGLAQAVIPRGGEITGLAGMLLMTTIFGYLSMTAKHIIAGKNPRDFTESPEAFRDVFIAAFVQGGGAGIYGDFLLGEKSRMGDDFLSTLAGPTMGSASTLVSLYKSVRDGEDAQSQAFRALWSHLPFNNLFWLRPAFDHMLLYSAYEYFNPGYIRRMRRRIKKENNQEFFMEPHIWDWARHRRKRKG